MFLDFFAKVAWPVVVVVLCVIFRRSAVGFLDELQELAFPGGHLKRREGDRRAAEIRHDPNLTQVEVQQFLPEVLALAREDGANRARAEDALNKIRYFTMAARERVRSNRDFARGRGMSSTKSVASAGSWLSTLHDFLNEEKLIVFLPEIFRIRLDEMVDLANDAANGKVKVSKSGANDFFEGAHSWFDETLRFADGRIAALKSPREQSPAPVNRQSPAVEVRSNQGRDS